MKKTTYLAPVIALGLMSGAAHADFNAELQGAVVKLDDSKTYGIGGSYYFNNVNTSKGPLAEATFLDRQSSVDVSFSRYDYDNFGELNAWALGGTYVVEGTGLYLNASAFHANGFSGDSYTFGGGYYLSPDWSVSLNADYDEDLDYQGFSLGSKKLFNLGNDTFFNLEAEYTNPDEGDDSYAVAGDYYLNRAMSVGLSYEWADKFSDGITSVRGSWFVNEQIGLTAAIGHADIEDESDTIYSLGATMRF